MNSELASIEDVREGRTYELNFTIKNTGDAEMTQNIQALAPVKSNGEGSTLEPTSKSELPINQTQDLTLKPGEQQKFNTTMYPDNLTWNTQVGDSGTYTYKINTENNTDTQKFIIQEEDTTQPATVHEGGDNTKTLQWGTTGDKSIKLPDFGTIGVAGEEFCIGNQCTPYTDRQPVNNPNSERTQFLNRYWGRMNGTIKVTDKIDTGGPGKDLCIGSACPSEDLGDAPESDLYGTSENGDGPMDGPVKFHKQFANPAIVTDASVCVGSEC
jgi:hypothetical protein